MKRIGNQTLRASLDAIVFEIKERSRHRLRCLLHFEVLGMHNNFIPTLVDDGCLIRMMNSDYYVVR